jgi:DNA-binding XRE family transcriptional regulator
MVAPCCRTTMVVIRECGHDARASRRKKPTREGRSVWLPGPKSSKERGLTQEVLAERTELSVSYIGFIERGENVPTLTIVLNLAEALEVEAADLVREVSRGR